MTARPNFGLEAQRHEALGPDPYAGYLQALRTHHGDIPTMVNAIYANLDPRLLKAAGMSVLAHLEDLVARGAVATNGPPSIAGRYRLA